MSSIIIPARRSIALAEDIADDVMCKILDMPNILYPSVTVAIYIAAWCERRKDLRTWTNVFNATYDYLARTFEANIDVDEGSDEVLWVSDDLPTMFDTLREMDVIVAHLAEAIIDGMGEYTLESNEDWFTLQDVMRKECRGLPMKYMGSYTMPGINLRQKTITLYGDHLMGLITI